MTQAGEVRSYEKEMGVTHAEFFRLLPTALGSEAYARNGNRVVLEDDGRRVAIELGVERQRQIALLSIPSTRIWLELSGFSDDDADAFVRRFERTYQRGGG